MDGRSKTLENASGLSVDEKTAIIDFVRQLKDRFGSAVREVVLFGSKAQGGESSDSDIDILIVLDGLSWEKKKDISQLAAEENLKHDSLICTVRYDADLWGMPAIQASPFVKSVRETGIWL